MPVHSGKSPLVSRRVVLLLALFAALLVWYAATSKFFASVEPTTAAGDHATPPDQSPRYYSQFGQDRWVLEHVFPGVRDGYFVDVGSGDGIITSNTKALEDSGWTGLCIDPFPSSMESRTCLLFRGVVYSSEGEIVSFRDAGPLGGIDEHIDVYRDVTSGARLVSFKTTTIGSVLERAQAPEFIHYVSIDTEGSEYEILKVFPFDRYSVGAFSIEHNFLEERQQNVQTLLAENGYRFVATLGMDDLFVREGDRRDRR